MALLSKLSAGLNLAEASIFAACAMALTVFDISKAVEDGVEITPEVAYTTGTIRCVRVSA